MTLKLLPVDIVAHIRQLLVLHDCVIVPDFGGFVANYRPAEINFSRNSFAPPSKQIGFNQNLSGNDGLLIGHVSERTGMGYVDARRLVAGFVKSVQEKLANGKKVVFEEIGVFRFDRQKNLQFEPGHTLNYLIDSYGLSWFTASPLEGYDVRKKIRKFRDQPPARKQQSRVLRRVLIGIPVLVALALVPLKIHYIDHLDIDLSSLNPLKKKNHQVLVEKTAETTSASVDFMEAAENMEKQVETELPDVQASPQIVEISEKIPETAEPRYYIIAGSFRSESNARTLQTDLRSAGYETLLLDAPNGLYRVSLAGFSDRDTALKELSAIRQLPGKESVWLFTR